MHDTYSGGRNRIEFSRLPSSIFHRLGLPLPSIKAMSQFPFWMSNISFCGCSSCIRYEKIKNDTIISRLVFHHTMLNALLIYRYMTNFHCRKQNSGAQIIISVKSPPLEYNFQRSVNIEQPQWADSRYFSFKSLLAPSSNWCSSPRFKLDLKEDCWSLILVLKLWELKKGSMDFTSSLPRASPSSWGVLTIPCLWPSSKVAEHTSFTWDGHIKLFAIIFRKEFNLC